MSASPWKNIRYRCEWLGIWLLSNAIPLVPRTLVLLGAKGLGLMAYHLDKSGRTTALENLHAAFGNDLNDKERRRLAKLSYQSFARTVCDQFWTRRITKENFSKYCRIEFDSEDDFRNATQSGAIWVTPHYGNFEWIALCAGFLDLSFLIIAQEFGNPLLTDIFKKNREASGHKVVAQRHAMLRMMKHLQNGGHAAFLTDLTIRPSKAATVIECMGLKTCVTNLHANLLKRTKLPVIPGICIPSDDGTYTMRALPQLRLPEDATIQQLTQACWDAFEPVIRQNPEHWIWMYKHWRYKPREHKRTYPAYSNFSKRFDNVLALALAENDTSSAS
ncbi:MAG: lysophospholipid acyltransferase family protein [Verrucomicrobiota bacterium]